MKNFICNYEIALHALVHIHMSYNLNDISLVHSFKFKKRNVST